MAKRVGLYDFDFVTVKAYGPHRFKMTYHCRGVRRAGYELARGMAPRGRGEIGEAEAGAGWALSEREWERADSSFRRAKATVLELGLCNDWDYFVTLTLDRKKYDRYDLPRFQKDFAQWVRDQRKRWGCAFRYLLIPEPHKDGAWHMHGFFAGLDRGMLGKNRNGYWHMPGYFDKFGFMSLGKLRNKEAAAKYVLKYITKDLAARKAEYHSHFFYASQGLKRAKVIDRGTILHQSENFWDFCNDFVKIKWLDKPPIIQSDRGYPVDNLRIVERGEDFAHRVYSEGGNGASTGGIDAAKPACARDQHEHGIADWRCAPAENGADCAAFFGAGGKDRKTQESLFARGSGGAMQEDGRGDLCVSEQARRAQTPHQTGRLEGFEADCGAVSAAYESGPALLQEDLCGGGI